MPRPVALLFLVLAFAGPLLTHAEAADDVAHLLIPADGDLEKPDGGIGDDPNVASVWRPGPAIDAFDLAIPCWDVLPLPAVLERRDPDLRRRYRDDVGPWPPPGTPLLAWLSFFLC